MKRLAIIPILIVLAGCGSLASLSTSDRAFVLCSGYTSALEKLTVYKSQGKLTAGMIETVDAIRPVAKQTCDDPQVSAGQLDKLELALTTLLRIRQEVQ